MRKTKWAEDGAGWGSGAVFFSGSDQPLALDPIQGPVERPGEALEQRIDLVGRDDQRWADRDHVAGDEAHDQPLLLGEANRPRADAGLGLEQALACLVGDQLDRADHPVAARLADQRMLAELGEPRLELRGLARRLLGNALARVN